MSERPAQPAPIEFLFRDETAVVVTKPSGMLVHRTREATDARVFLLQEVRDRVARLVYPLHRLDRPVSGVMLFALSSDATARWQESFGSPDTVKEYLALVRGVCPEAWSMDHPLTDERGVKREARTTFYRVLSFDRLSLVRVHLLTGRRHQIRRHLAHAAHQIVGDSSYGKGRINRELREEHGLARIFLHAARLRIRHPYTGEILDLRAPLPGDLRGFLERHPAFPGDRLAEL